MKKCVEYEYNVDIGHITDITYDSQGNIVHIWLEQPNGKIIKLGRERFYSSHTKQLKDMEADDRINNGWERKLMLGTRLLCYGTID